MELILEYFSWCEGGIKSSIDPGDRVSSSASEEEEEEAVVGIRAGKNEKPLYQRKKKTKWLWELRLGIMKDHCIRGRRRRRSSCQN